MSNALLPLAFLACPIGMGLMMFFMARGAKRDRGEQPTQPSVPEQPASVEVLREEQRRLSDEIDRLEGETTGEPSRAGSSS